jgi:hypothetical protein
LGCGTNTDIGNFHSPVGGTLPPCSTAFGYGSFQGTSMASPHVAGVVALMMSKSADLRSGAPNTWAKVRSYLMDASSLSGLALCEPGCGAGLLDAQKAVQLAAANGSIGPILVRADTAGAIDLDAFGLEGGITVKNIGDAPATGTITVTGAGLSLISPATLSLAGGEEQKIEVRVDRTNLSGRIGGRIDIAYGLRQFQERVYYQGDAEPLVNVSDYFVRIYKKGVSGQPRKRLNYPDMPLQPGGQFQLSGLEPGTYDITVYHSTGVNADGTINADELGEATGLRVFGEVLTDHPVQLNRVSQTICSREGTLKDGPTKCPGTP